MQGSSDAFIVRVDAATGEARRIFTDARYGIQAVATTEGVLVVRAQPSFDTTKSEVWGLDGKTGERKWQIGLKTRHSFDDFGLHSSASGLSLAQTLWEEGKVLFNVLDPRTGVSKGQVVETIKRAGLTGSTFAPGRAWLNIVGHCTRWIWPPER